MYLLSYLLQLAELLGFSQLDLIQQLLTHRHEIVDSTLKDATALLKSGKCNIMKRIFHLIIEVSYFVQLVLENLLENK